MELFLLTVVSRGTIRTAHRKDGRDWRQSDTARFTTDKGGTLFDVHHLVQQKLEPFDSTVHAQHPKLLGFLQW